MRDCFGRSGKAIWYVLVALVVVPAAVFGLRQWMKVSRVVTEADMVGVWSLTEGPRTGPPTPFEAWLAQQTNQWIALGSKGRCWFHTVSAVSPWLGNASADQLRTFGESLSPYDWVGGPASLAYQPQDEPGRRKQREITKPVLTWQHRPADGRSKSLGLAEIKILREGRLDGSMGLEAVRSADGEARLRLLVKPDGVSTYIYLRKSADTDIESLPQEPAPEAKPAATTG